MTTTKPTDGMTIISLNVPHRMSVPHNRPPQPRLRTPEPAEVVELRAPWQATDRLIEMLSDRIARDMSALLTVMPLGEAEQCCLYALRHGVMKATIDECEKNAALRRKAMERL